MWKILKTKLLAVFAVLITLTTVMGSSLQETAPAMTGAVGAIIGGIIVVLITVAMMGTIANNTAAVVAYTTTDTSTDSMLRLLPFGVALIAFISLFAFLL